LSETTLNPLVFHRNWFFCAKNSQFHSEFKNLRKIEPSKNSVSSCSLSAVLIYSPLSVLPFKTNNKSEKYAYLVPIEQINREKNAEESVFAAAHPI